MEELVVGNKVLQGLLWASEPCLVVAGQLEFKFVWVSGAGILKYSICASTFSLKGWHTENLARGSLFQSADEL